MSSYEDEMREIASRCDAIPDKISLGTLRYLWQAGPFALNKSESLPRFLSQMSIFKTFSGYELKSLSEFLHRRRFARGEVVFKQGDIGYGFYLVFSGQINIIHVSGTSSDFKEHHVAKILPSQYFGEMGLLEDLNRRSATAVCGEDTVLLGLFKPDLEALLDKHPTVGAKFMRELALILAQRLGSVISEVSALRHRLADLEAKK